jgi:hypothetical protein
MNLASLNHSLTWLTLNGATCVRAHSNSFRIIVEMQSIDWELRLWATVWKANVLCFAARSVLYCQWVFPKKKGINFLLYASDSLCLLALTLFFMQFLSSWLIEKTISHNVHFTLFTSVSSLIRNGYLRLRTSENKHFLQRGIQWLFSFRITIILSNYINLVWSYSPKYNTLMILNITCFIDREVIC